MHFTTLLSLVSLATLVSHIQVASGECCGCVKHKDYEPPRYCRDDTRCTPYCGYGPCNIFGCNCDGGCRPGDYFRARSSADTGLADADATESRFNAADANNDGKLTFGEWAGTNENKDMDKDILAAHWAKFGGADAGYLTKAEAVSRKA